MFDRFNLTCVLSLASNNFALAVSPCPATLVVAGQIRTWSLAWKMSNPSWFVELYAFTFSAVCIDQSKVRASRKADEAEPSASMPS